MPWLNGIGRDNYSIRYQLHVAADSHADAASPQTTHKCRISAGPSVYAARHGTGHTDEQMDRQITVLLIVPYRRAGGIIICVKFCKMA